MRSLAMGRHGTPRGGAFALLLAMLVLAATPAHAHRINLFALVEGTTITGSAYFSGGGNPVDTPVLVFGPDGSLLGEAVTDAEGRFTFEATVRVDHTLVIDTGDGHRAEFTVPAAELPASLPDPEAAGSDAAGPEAARSGAAHAAEPPGTMPAAAVDGQALQDLVDAAVARQVAPLRQELAQYQASLRYSDILGGIGYIFGIAGVAFYLLARRRRPHKG